MGPERPRAAMVSGQQWCVLYCVIRVMLIHVCSHGHEDIVLNFRSGDMDNVRWKSLLRATAGELTNGKDYC